MSYNISNIMYDNPIQTLEEEKEMIEKLKNDREKLTEQLILHNVGIVACVVNRMCKKYERRDEYTSYGMEGLVVAAREFDTSLPYKFSNYAFHCVQNMIYRRTRLSKIDKNCFYLQTPLKSGKSTDPTEDDWERNVESKIYKEIDPDYLTVKPTDMIVDKNSHDTAAKEVLRYLRRTESKLINKKNRRIFLEYFTKDTSLEKIGKRYHMTKERVRQIIKNTRPAIEELISKRYNVKNMNELKMKIL